ncbi:hypothetical protein P8605_08335 [Streptomyces sp. T-3]|nr:hypothetical protein [Streptomyces sp. T-3]
MTVPLRPMAAAALFLALAATGCAAGAATPPPEKKPTAPAVSKEAAELTLPFDTYRLDSTSRRTIEAAEEVLLRDCMRRRGMRWTLLPRTKGRPDPPNRRRYGVIEADVTRSFGYRPPPEPPAEARHTALRDERDKGLPSKVFRAAYGSDGLGGCWKLAGAELREGIPGSDESRFDDLDEEAYEASQRDDKVVEAVRTWRGCMRDAGFDYDHPLKAASDPRWRKTDQASPREIETAATDVRCKRRSRLVAVWSAAEGRLQRAAIDRHAGYFRDRKAADSRLLAAAREVLDAPAGRE